MTWDAAIALGVYLTSIIGGGAWWIVRTLWHFDVRLTRVEDIVIARNRDRDQRDRSGRKLLSAVHAATDNGG